MSDFRFANMPTPARTYDELFRRTFTISSHLLYVLGTPYGEWLEQAIENDSLDEAKTTVARDFPHEQVVAYTFEGFYRQKSLGTEAPDAPRNVFVAEVKVTFIETHHKRRSPLLNK